MTKCKVVVQTAVHIAHPSAKGWRIFNPLLQEGIRGKKMEHNDIQILCIAEIEEIVQSYFRCRNGTRLHDKKWLHKELFSPGMLLLFQFAYDCDARKVAEKWEELIDSDDFSRKKWTMLKKENRMV